MIYDPQDPQHRLELAAALVVKIKECGFVEVKRPRTTERVYARQVDGHPGIQVLVYTSIVGRRIRERAKDAIRVCAIYTNSEGVERGIARAEKRVNRTGTFEGVVERVYQRLREVYGAALRPTCCPDCGAPMFRSKKKNDVCAELCWMTKRKVA